MGGRTMVRPGDLIRFHAGYAKDETSGCWTWTRPLHRGYGRFRVVGFGSIRVHRFAYTALVGPIPDGLEIDHKCRNRACVNPAHLELVTHIENMRRAVAVITHCPKGHPYSGKNLRFRIRNGRAARMCGRCRDINTRKRQQEKRDLWRAAGSVGRRPYG
jgi:hypothetical protein